MIVVKPLFEDCDYTYNLLFPEPDCINLFSGYDEIIKSISYNSKKDTIVVELPGKDIIYVSFIFNLNLYN